MLLISMHLIEFIQMFYRIAVIFIFILILLKKILVVDITIVHYKEIHLLHIPRFDNLLLNQSPYLPNRLSCFLLSC